MNYAANYIPCAWMGSIVHGHRTLMGSFWHNVAASQGRTYTLWKNYFSFLLKYQLMQTDCRCLPMPILCTGTLYSMKINSTDDETFPPVWCVYATCKIKGEYSTSQHNVRNNTKLLIQININGMNIRNVQINCWPLYPQESHLYPHSYLIEYRIVEWFY